jgi:hypothetical protein
MEINWISISEDVPDKIDKYHVLLDGKYLWEATWHSGRNCFVDMNLMMNLDEVTHWTKDSIDVDKLKSGVFNIIN